MIDDVLLEQIFDERSVPRLTPIPKSGNKLKNKFVRTTMRLCNATFVLIFLSFYGCYLFPWNGTIDFQLISLGIAVDFAIFTMWLHMYELTDQWTE